MSRLPRAVAVLPLLVVLQVVTALSHGAPWRGEWGWTLDYAVGSTILTGPLLGGVAAWFAVRERDRAVLHDSTARGWLVPARIAGGALVVGLAGWLIGFLLAVLATATVPHGGPFPLAVALVVPCLLGFYAAFGAALGHWFPALVVVVLVPVAGFVLGSLAVYGVGPNVLRIGLSSGSLAGLAWDRTVLLAQAAVVVGAAVVLLLAAGARRLLRSWLVVLPATVGVLLVVGGMLVLDRHGSESFVPSAERATRCAGDAPQVCVAPSNQRALAPVSTRIQQVAGVLRAAGAAVPSTYVAELPGAPRVSGVGLFSLGPEANRPRFRLFEAARAVTMPEPCSAWFGDRPPPESAFVARELIAAWTLRRLGLDTGAPVPEAERWLRDAPAVDQSAWVVRTFGQLRACELDRVRVPWNVAGR